MKQQTDTLRTLELHVLHMECTVQSLIRTCPRNSATLPLLIDLRETLDAFEITFYDHYHHIRK